MDDGRDDAATPVPIDPAAVRRAVEAGFRANVPPVYVGLGALYLLSALTVPLIYEPLSAWLIGVTVVVIGGTLLALGLRFRGHPMPLRAAVPLTILLVTLLTGINVLSAALTHDPGQASTILILFIGIGILVPDTRWVAASYLLVSAAWFLAWTGLGDPEGWRTGGATVVGGAVFGIVVNRVRLRGLERLEEARLRERAGRARLEEALATVGQKELRFRALLESAPEAFLLVDDGHRITFANRQTGRLFGHDPAHLIGRPVEHLVPDIRLDPEARHDPDGSLQGVREDGHRFPAEVGINRIESVGGDLVVVVRDLTERRKAVEADRVAFERLLEIKHLQEIDRIKTQILNTASHELNTPMTPLKLQVHLLKTGRYGELTEPQARSVGIVARNVDRLSMLIQDVLDVARLQSDALKLRFSQVDLRSLTADAVETFHEDAERRGIRLAAARGDAVMAELDRDRILQVLYNLVKNSLKFTPRGGSVSVSAYRDGSSAVLAVEDTGIGLTTDQVARLFQPFSQVHDPLQQSETGTGLGLYISRGIVEQHKGTIECHSDGTGQGSRFVVRLPIKARGDRRPMDTTDLT